MNGQQLFKAMGELDNKYLEEMDYKIVRRIKQRKLFLLAALFCLMGTMVSIGAIVSRRYNNQSNISINSTQATFEDYDSLQEAIKELSFAPEIPQEFSNGMFFSEGQIITVNDVGNKNIIIDQFPKVTIAYHLNNRRVILNCEPLDEEYMVFEGDNKVEYNGQDLYVDFDKILLVPQNLNDDELKTILANEQSDGAVLIKNDSIMQPLSRYRRKVLWVKNGILYTLTNLVDNKKDLIEEKEMITMVNEIIN